jgi:hypothetical protein
MIIIAWIHFIEPEAIDQFTIKLPHETSTTTKYTTLNCSFAVDNDGKPMIWASVYYTNLAVKEEDDRNCEAVKKEYDIKLAEYNKLKKEWCKKYESSIDLKDYIDCFSSNQK